MSAGRARGRTLAAGTFVLSAILFSLGGVQAARADGDAGPTPTATQSSTYDKVHSPFALTISPTRIAVGPKDEANTQTVLVVNRGEASLHVNRASRGRRTGACCSRRVPRILRPIGSQRRPVTSSWRLVPRKT
jgi:hypothetical protein